MEKNGAFMRMTKVPYVSKYRKVLAEARDYLQEVKDFRARQIALGLIVEEDDNEDTKKKFSSERSKPSFVSAETDKALLDSQKKLAEVISKSKAAGQLNEVWLRMMVDYWESKRLVE